MNVIYLVILFPLIGFLILSFLKHLLSNFHVMIIGVGSLFFSFITTMYVRSCFSSNQYSIFSTELWTWWRLEDFKINVCLLIDNLSLSFVMMIVCIGLLVNIFSVWYMKNQRGKSRFFSLVNLFIANMLLLVLSNNFILMYLGWEGVSICSYILINFYYFKNDVGKSAIKSFIMTRIGDLFLIIAIFILYIHYFTLNFYEIQFLVKIGLIQYKFILSIITILLLFGAIGKSAQIPLQTWLPEAMVGPTPVSALIHAATMVTAGVYLIIRNHDLFLLTPNILYLVGILGVVTLLLSSLSALVQVDIKRILAYSTMSQLGYMFVALSVGAWSAAIIHLITHAVFKALLFLATGSLILQCNHEKNIFHMGNNLWKKLPFLYICFLIGGSSLSAFPILTSGFYSKGEILFDILSSHSIIFFIISLFASFLTSIYIFRLIFIVFHLQSNIIHIHTSKNWTRNLSIDWIHNFPLIVLLLFSTCFLVYILPDFSDMFSEMHFNYQNKWYLEFCSGILVVIGIWIAYYFYFLKINVISKILKHQYLLSIFNLCYQGWGFFNFYNMVFVQPYLKMTHFFCFDPFYILIDFILTILKKCNVQLLRIENRFLNWYITAMIIGLIMIMIFIYLSFIIQ